MENKLYSIERIDNLLEALALKYDQQEVTGTFTLNTYEKAEMMEKETKYDLPEYWYDFEGNKMTVTWKRS